MVRQSVLPAIIIAALLAPPTLAGGSPLSDITVDVQEDAQPIRDVLRRLEQKHGLNYVANEQVLDQAGTVTVRLKKVPLDSALEAICAACGLSLEIRGPILVIVPRTDARPPLPRVTEGLAPEDDGRTRLPRPAAPRSEPQALQAVGRLIEVDAEARRLQLRIDGAKVDFYLPDAGSGEDAAGQAARLETAMASLRPGTRVALLYKRAGNRSVVTDLIGGTDPRRGRRPPAETPVEGEAPPAEPTEPAAPPAADDGARRLTPVDGEKAAPPMPSGALVGRFVARDGETVKVRLPSEAVVELQLPPSDGSSDRRDRILAAIDTLRADDRIMLTYEEKQGVKVITNTITESR